MTEKIVACQKNAFGNIINFQTSSGRIISYRKAVAEIENGIILGAEIIYNSQSEIPIIQSIEQEECGSLDDLPSI